MGASFGVPHRGRPRVGGGRASAATLRYDTPAGGSALTLVRAGSDLRVVDDATGGGVASSALAATTGVDIQ